MGAHVVPNFARHFVFFVARCWHTAKVAIGDVFNFIIVVKHHFAVAGDAKVLPQHIARKDVGRHQIFDGVAVLHHRTLHLAFGSHIIQACIKRLLQINIQGNHAPLDVSVFDHHLFQASVSTAVDLDLAGREFLNFGDQLVFKTLTRKRHIAVFQGVGHAPHTVVLFHQQILALNLLTRGVFLRRVKIFDDLEHKRKRGLVEHQHDHALDAWSDAKFIGAMALVIKQVAVKQSLALLGQTQSVVDFCTRFTRHHAAQKLHIG